MKRGDKQITYAGLIYGNKVLDSYMRIKAARDSGSWLDAEGDYIDGVIDALAYVLGGHKSIMPWIKKVK